MVNQNTKLLIFKFTFNSLIPILIADASRHSARILLAIFFFFGQRQLLLD